MLLNANVCSKHELIEEQHKRDLDEEIEFYEMVKFLKKMRAQFNPGDSMVIIVADSTITSNGRKGGERFQ